MATPQQPPDDKDKSEGTNPDGLTPPTPPTASSDTDGIPIVGKNPNRWRRGQDRSREERKAARRGKIDPTMGEHLDKGFPNTKIGNIRRTLGGQSSNTFTYEVPLEEKILWSQFRADAHEVEKQSRLKYWGPVKKRQLQRRVEDLFKQNIFECINFYFSGSRLAAPCGDMGPPLPILLAVKIDGETRDKWRLGIKYQVITSRSEYVVGVLGGLLGVRLAVPYFLTFHRKDGRVFKKLQGKLCVAELLPNGGIISSETLFRNDDKIVLAGSEYGTFVPAKEDPNSDVVDTGFLYFDCIPPNDESGRRAVRFDEIEYGYMLIQLQCGVVRQTLFNKKYNAALKRGIQISAGSGIVKVLFTKDGKYRTEP